MACGIPVVVTKSGGPEEIVTDNKNGVLVVCGMGDQLFVSIIRLIRLIREKKMINRLVRNGAELVKDRFSIKVMLLEYSDLYLGIY